MATTGTSALSNEVKALYDGHFYLQGQSLVYWDQFCDLREQMNGVRGQTYNFPVIESLQPNTGALDELSDVVAQQMRAAEIVVTLQEFGGAVEVTKFAVATSYADVYKQAAYVNGYNLAESLDMVVRATAGQGSRTLFPSGVTARTALNSQTTAHRLGPALVELWAIIARTIKMPLYEDGAVVTCIHPFAFYDMLQDTNGTGVRVMSQYSHPEILFNGELAYWGGMRFIVSANAKAFWGVGTSTVSGGTAASTTLSAQVNVGDTALSVASGTNLVNGSWIAVQDGNETGNTWFDTNELFRVTSGGGTTTLTGFMLDPGPAVGSNEGGARYAHASGKTVINNSAAYPVVIMGPNSITKVCSSWTGPYGETVVTGPFDRLGRMLTFGWYAILGYARTRNAWLLRGEVSSSQA